MRGFVYSSDTPAIMKSGTQQSVSQEDVIAIVNRHFNDTEVGEIRQLDEGWYSVAYDVTLPQETYDLIIKFEIPDKSLTQRYERYCLETEIESVLHVREQDDSIPLSEILAYDTEIDRGYIIYRKLQGEPLERIKTQLSSEEIKQIHTHLAQIQPRLNTIEGPHFGYFSANPDWPVAEKSWSIAFRKMMLSLWEDARDLAVDMPLSWDDMEQLLDQYQSDLMEVKTPRFVHWDINEGNYFVIQTKKGWQVEAIIDFERSLWADPLMELAYRKSVYHETELSPSELVRTVFYDLYLGLIVHIEPIVRQYSHEDTQRSLGWARDWWQPALDYLQQ